MSLRHLSLSGGPGKPMRRFRRFSPFAGERYLMRSEKPPRISLRRPDFLLWSLCPGLNWRPRPYQGRALPTELQRHLYGWCGSEPTPEGEFRQAKREKNNIFLLCLQSRACVAVRTAFSGMERFRESLLFLVAERSYAGSTSALRPSCRLFSSSFLPMKTRLVPVRPSGGLRQLISSPTTSR